MKKQKRKFDIYCVTSQEFDNEYQEYEEKVGTTYAVSEKQAINNYCFRNGLRKETWLNYGGDDYGHVCYIAKEIN